MKISKLITLDSELAQLLAKEDNASGLINKLLHQYYDIELRDFEKKNPRAQTEAEGNSQNDATIKEKT